MNEIQGPKSVRKYSDQIPDDVLMDIFSRVEGKSIARFRCVSKSWGHILRLPYFTELFLTKSSTRPRLFFALEDNGKIFFYSSPQPQNPNENSTLVATRYHTSFPQYIPYSYCSTVCGLALFHRDNDRDMWVICNPITGEFLTLPAVKAKSKHPDDIEAENIFEEIFFGYDPIRKQFKVLNRTSSVGYESPLCKITNTQQHVLTLESGKPLWRRIQCKVHFVSSNRMSSGICIDGVLYYGSDMGHRQVTVVVCFDVRSEKLSFIKMNKEMLDYACVGLTLFNYKGKVGIRQETDWDRDDELVLWVLKDAENHKWSKQTYKLPRLIGSKQFAGMTGTGEIVFTSYNNQGDENFHVYFYNLERKTITRVNIQGFEEFRYPLISTFLDFVENLKFM